MINLNIDGNRVYANMGATILEVCQENNIKIPTLCHYRNLEPFGACRICLVEVEKVPKLVPACATPVAENMVVHTFSDRIMDARKTNLELILSNHSYESIICDQNGCCELQDLAYEYHVDLSRFQGERSQYPVDDTNPFILRDHGKCILCGRCVRVCDEVQRVNGIDFLERGFSTRIGTAFDHPLDCEFCGQCISVCPTGALSSKLAKHKGRTWQLNEIVTTCPYCGCGCQLSLQLKDDKIVKISSPEDSVNEGYLCSKGRFGYDFVFSDKRLTTPLAKSYKGFEPIEWDTAYKNISERLREIKDKYGADAIAGLSSAKCTNEENYLFQKLMRAVIGTNNVDHCARL